MSTRKQSRRYYVAAECHVKPLSHCYQTTVRVFIDTFLRIASIFPFDGGEMNCHMKAVLYPGYENQYEVYIRN